MQSKPLYMVQLGLDMRRLAHAGRRMRLPLHATDDGYLVHCQLGQLFGNHAPKPFTLSRPRSRWLEVLAYTTRDVEDLRRHADTFADPSVHSSCDWDALAQKRLPTSWIEGTRYRFRVRTCPVVRASADGPHYRRGSEVDAYLAHCAAAGAGGSASRETVYTEWFTGQIERRGGARIDSCGMTGFRLVRLVRRAHDNGRRATIQQRPDVTLTGTLTVTEGNRFTELVRNGVGRHRAFGFGMLLLRPAV